MLVGSALAWWSASATWVLVERSLLGDSTSSEMTDVRAVGLLGVSGGSVVSIAAAAPIIGFAGLAGVIGSRGWLRRIVGVVVAIAGIALCASPCVSCRRCGPPSPGSRWKWRPERGDGFDGVAGAIVAGLLLLAGGLLTTTGHRWPTLGAGYERKVPNHAMRGMHSMPDWIRRWTKKAAWGRYRHGTAKRPEPEPER